jgi:hypothetical protein
MLQGRLDVKYYAFLLSTTILFKIKFNLSSIKPHET